MSAANLRDIARRACRDLRLIEQCESVAEWRPERPIAASKFNEG
jgi:hypothetical protein